MSSNIEITKACLFCGNSFTAHTLHTRYCSHSCNRKHYKQVKREEKLAKFTASEGNHTSIPNTEMAALQLKTFLSIDEAAMLLGASRRTIQRLIAKGSIKAGKLGSRSIIQRAEIDKLFN